MFLKLEILISVIWFTVLDFIQIVTDYCVAWYFSTDNSDVDSGNEDMQEFTDDNREWLKPAKQKKAVKKRVVEEESEEEEEMEEEDVSDDEENDSSDDAEESDEEMVMEYKRNKCILIYCLQYDIFHELNCRIKYVCIVFVSLKWVALPLKLRVFSCA